MGGTIMSNYYRAMNEDFGDNTEKVSLIDQINQYCYEHYEDGGDIVVETMDDEEKLARFETLGDLKEYIEVQQEHREEIQATVW